MQIEEEELLELRIRGDSVDFVHGSNAKENDSEHGLGP